MVIVTYEVAVLDVTCNDLVITDCSDLNAVNIAFFTWLEDTDYFDFVGGCNPVESFDDENDLAAPNACGGSVTVTYRVESDCHEDATCQATFTLLVSEVVATCPDPVSVDACDIDDIEEAYLAWLDGFMSGGDCDTEASGLPNPEDIPSTCGDFLEVTFTLTDACGQVSTCESSFEVKDALPITASCPSSVSVSACESAIAIAPQYDAWFRGFYVVEYCGLTSNIDELSSDVPNRCGDEYTFTLEVEADCSQPFQCSSTFSIASADPIVVVCPTPVDITMACSDQEDIDEAYASWLAGFSTTGGCEDELDITGLPDAQAPSFCGDLIPVVYSASDNCQDPVSCTSSFAVAFALDVEITCPDDVIINDCSDQDAIDIAFLTWLESRDNFDFEGGCNTEESFDNEMSLSAPNACGESITVTYRVKSDCHEDATCSATFTVVLPEVVATCPDPVTVDACDIDGIEEAYLAWLGGFMSAGGCGDITPSGLPDAEDIPLSCGDFLEVTFTLTNACDQVSTCESSFTVSLPLPLSIACPSSEDVEACDDQDYINGLYATWRAGFTFVDYCNATSNIANLSETAPSRCGGTPISFEFVVNADCDLVATCASTFTVASPDPLTVECPEDFTISTCEQSEINAEFGAWIADFESDGGCDVSAFNFDDYAAPSFCGGEEVIVFALTDACGQSASCTSSFGVIAPDPLSLFTCPDNISVDPCLTQDAVSEAYFLWLEGFSSEVGCPLEVNLIESGDFDEVTRCGGNIEVVYNVILDEACGESQTCTRTFTVRSSPNLRVQCPTSVPVPACTSQEDVQEAYDTWRNGFSYLGGCSPVDVSEITTTAPDACGGSLAVVYIATDGCITSSCQSTFSVAVAPALTISCPESQEITACSDEDIAAQFNTWKGLFTANNGCDPTSSDLSAIMAPGACGGEQEIVFSASDNCTGTVSCTRTFKVLSPDDFSVSCPESVTLTACDDQSAIDEAFVLWIAGFTSSGGCGTVTSTVLSGFNAPTTCVTEDQIISITYEATPNCGDEKSCTSHFELPASPEFIPAICPDNVTLVACVQPDDLEEAYMDWFSQFNFDGGCNSVESFVLKILDFTSALSSDNWTFYAGGGNGSYMFTDEESLSITGSNTNSGFPGSTSICVTAPFDGTLSFDWDYNTLDPEGPFFDPFGYSLNDVFVLLVDVNGPNAQNGSTSVSLSAGDEFCFVVNTFDNTFGAATAMIDNLELFKGGEPAMPTSCGGIVPIVYTVNSDCEEETYTCYSVFTVPQASDTEPLNVTCTDHVMNACPENQDAVDAAFALWLGTFDAEGGCGATTTDLSIFTAPTNLCGSETLVTFIASDPCGQEASCSATFSIQSTPGINVTTQPQPASVTSCEFADQGALENAYSAWLSAQGAAIAYTGGCNVAVSTPTESGDALMLCSPGSRTATWTITSDCGDVIELSATYSLTVPAVEHAEPTDAIVYACSLQNPDQVTVTAIYNNWLTAQTDLIAPTGGCAPVLSAPVIVGDIPLLCTGGVVTVTWSISDLCYNTSVTATFTLVSPTEVTFFQPEDAEYSSCAFTDQDDLLETFEDWIAAQEDAINAMGGCNVMVSEANLGEQEIPDFCSGGDITVTWTISDLCFSESVSAVFSVVSPTTGIAFDQTVSATVDADCGSVPTAATLTASNSCSNNVTVTFSETREDGICAGNYTLTRTWTATDCTGSITTTQTVYVSDLTPPALMGELPGGLLINIAIEDALDFAPVTSTIAAAYEDDCSDVVVNLTGTDIVGNRCNWTATFTYSVADACGNVTETAVVIYSSSDTEAPSITCSATINVDPAPGECEAMVDIFAPEVTDNCSVGLVAIGVRDDMADLGDPYPSGTTTITWTVTDQGGIESVCEQLIIVSGNSVMNVSGQGVDIENGDDSPDIADGTKFGSTALNGTITRTFTIENLGCADLNLTGSPFLVTLSGANSSFFAVSTQPAEDELSEGESTTFQVTYTGTEYGVHNAVVSIANDDEENDPYTFEISAATSQALIRVSGNNLTIENGDNTPRTADFTDYGVNSFNTTRTRTFRVHNDGISTLNLTGSPRVKVIGGNGKFVVTTQPQATVLPGANRLFQIRFTANQAGVFTATVSIESSDQGSSPYTFDITATVLAPEMNVLGNGELISSGDVTPDVLDNTDFGSTDINVPVEKTFIIENDGDGDLYLGGTPRVALIGADAVHFTVSSIPALSISAGSSSMLKITYNPLDASDVPHSVMVSIANNDPLAGKNPYTFVIQGTPPPIVPFIGADQRGFEQDANQQVGAELKAYPNPVQSMLFVEAPVMENSYRLEVLNLSGSVVHALNTFGGRLELNVADFKPGMYVIRAHGATLKPIRFIRIE